MGILSGPEIAFVINRTRRIRDIGGVECLPAIDIDPFDPDAVGPNSVDLRLGPKLLVYRRAQPDAGPVLDARVDNLTDEIVVPGNGYFLEPGTLYLGSTAERTACAGVVPCIETRSSVARLGISAHLSAGFGDDGWGEGVGGCCWTLEITVVHPVRVYAGMRIAQITFTTLVGDRRPYRGKYTHSDGPVASRLHLDKRG